MLNEHVTLPPLSRDIFNDQHGYNMTQLQGYNAKLSQPGMFGAENIPTKNGSHCHVFAA